MKCQDVAPQTLPRTSCTPGTMVWDENSQVLPLHFGFCCAAAFCSCEVLCACRWHLWPGKMIEDRLAAAYDDFYCWRKRDHVNSSINKFDLKTTFKMTSPLSHTDLCVHTETCIHTCKCVHTQMLAAASMPCMHTL